MTIIDNVIDCFQETPEKRFVSSVVATRNVANVMFDTGRDGLHHSCRIAHAHGRTGPPDTCQVGRLVRRSGGPPRQMLKEGVGRRRG